MIFRQIQEIIDELKKETRRAYKPGEYATDRDGELVITPDGQRVSDCPIDTVFTPGGRVKWRVLGFYSVVPKRGKPQIMWDRREHHLIYPDHCPMSVEEWTYKCKMAGWMRLSIRIQQIRWERLQDISLDDVEAEGIAPFTFARGIFSDTPPDPRWKYIELWKSINGKGSWDLNPYVWPITFGLQKSNNFHTDIKTGVTYYE